MPIFETWVIKYSNINKVVKIETEQDYKIEVRCAKWAVSKIKTDL